MQIFKYCNTSKIKTKITRPIMRRLFNHWLTASWTTDCLCTIKQTIKQAIEHLLKGLIRLVVKINLIIFNSRYKDLGFVDSLSNNRLILFSNELESNSLYIRYSLSFPRSPRLKIDSAESMQTHAFTDSAQIKYSNSLNQLWI